MWKRVLLAYLVLVLGAVPALAASPNLAMGMPSPATADPSNRNDFLLDRTYFAESYNDTRGEPNWVAWRLVASDVGHAPRVKFYADPDLPADFKHVDPTDYTDSGLDRGHLCDHADRSSTLEASTATFTMANMIPQAPNVNRRAWAHLEDYCRELTKQGKTLYVYSGAAGQGGEGADGPATVIGHTHHVVVPARCWKVIMVLDGNGRAATDDITAVSSATRMIAVIMPNDQSVGEPWAGFRVSVADVEKLTGFTFFSNVSAEIMGPLKQQVDTTFVPDPTPYPHPERISH